MEITVGLFLFIVALAFLCELLDSSLGMGYGTILSPVLIIMGFSPLVAVPAVLLSQAFGGFAASAFHHLFRNVSFHPTSRDFKIVLVISSFGVLATIFAAIIALNVPKLFLQVYIGVLVLVMGIIVLLNLKFTFSWGKMIGVGILSAFNKGISGGGFGPVVTAGQIMAGQGHKGAIGATTLAEAPICIASFITYLIGKTMKQFDGSIMRMPVNEFFAKMFSPGLFQWNLTLALLIGAVLVAPFGAFATKKMDTRYMHIVLGILITILGIWTLIKAFS
ncbi:MAG: sulfite exporter TauE/SafE family protein [Candidatus Omnitrophota bacterium]